MNWFPRITSHSPTKVNNILKQDKAAARKEHEPETEDENEEQAPQQGAEGDKKDKGLLDIYV